MHHVRDSVTPRLSLTPTWCGPGLGRPGLRAVVGPAGGVREGVGGVVKGEGAAATCLACGPGVAPLSLGGQQGAGGGAGGLQEGGGAVVSEHVGWCMDTGSGEAARGHEASCQASVAVLSQHCHGRKASFQRQQHDCASEVGLGANVLQPDLAESNRPTGSWLRAPASGTSSSPLVSSHKHGSAEHVTQTRFQRFSS